MLPMMRRLALHRGVDRGAFTRRQQQHVQHHRSGASVVRARSTSGVRGDDDGAGSNGAASFDERRCRGLNDAGRAVLSSWSARAADDWDDGRPVVYWCSRDRRMRDNDALRTATALASVSSPSLSRRRSGRVIVCVHLGKDERGTGIGGARRAAFALEGLRELERDLRAKGIAMEASIEDDAMQGVSDVARKANAKAVVCDFTPLREGRSARERLAKELTCAVIEVDAHNVVPAWLVSDKQEYAARTLRPKIKRALDTFLTEPVGDIDAVHDAAELQFSTSTSTPMIDWDAHLTAARRDGAHVPEVKGWITPGERAALTALCGPDENAFLPTRLAMYAERNKPTSPLSVSRLSPYLNFGHLAPRRAAWEAAKLRGQNDTLNEAIDSYLEELIVRRELSDNFCLHNPRYDALDGASAWARESLEAHASDRREYVYDYKTLERGRTHDELWNAAQHELLYLGRMHGFMRMYWAKKILEWTPSPETALTTAIALNDAYALDGLDPNGYVGCMWSIAGIHDQGWKERAVFGKVRYMNYAGCKRKFDIAAYVSRIASEVKAVKTRA